MEMSEESHICPKCEIKFPTKDLLQLHEKIHDVFICRCCQHVMTSLKSYRHHLSHCKVKKRKLAADEPPSTSSFESSSVQVEKDDISVFVADVEIGNFESSYFVSSLIISIRRNSPCGDSNTH